MGESPSLIESHLVNALPSLPPVLQRKFIRLERRVRTARLWRLLTAAAIAFTGIFLGAYLFEMVVGWSVRGLRGANLGLLCLAVFMTGAAWLTWRRRLLWHRLAALVERRFPDLGERLVSTVQLSEAPAAPSGRGDLLPWLREETVQRATPLDFQSAYSIGPLRKLTVAGGVLLLLALVPALGSEEYVRFGRRLLLAWSPSVYGYELTVEPGDQYIGRGRSAVVRVGLKARDAEARLPSSCTLICAENGTPRRLRMEPTEAGQFTFTWPVVQESLTYHIEAGELVSAKYRLEAIDPVALLPESPKTRVTPPPYVQAAVLAETESVGHVPFTALQFSKVKFQFRFDRPARKATIRWRRGDEESQIVLPLVEERTEAAWELIAVASGPHAATLSLEGEHGIVSTYPLPAWSVWTDDAPRFSAAPVLGFSSTDERPSVVPPDEVIPIKASAEDKVGIERLELQYRVNDGPVQVLALGDGKGETRLVVDTVWPLRGLVKAGDTVKCRLALADNRRLAHGQVRTSAASAPEHDLDPQVAHLPSRAAGEDRWWHLKIEAKAESLVQQQVVAERDDLRQALERIQTRIEEERKQIEKVRQGSHQQPVLSVDQGNALGQARKLNEASQQQLQQVGQKAASIPGLQSLARLALDIARRELAASEDAIAESQTKNLPAGKREAEMHKAEDALGTALQRLEELQKLNDLLARERLDVENLEKLARAEEMLAKQVEELAARPDGDPKELERLRAEQAKIAARLEQLGQDNPRLQEVGRKLRQAHVQKLGQEARALAMNQRKQSEADEAKWIRAMKSQSADLALQQRALANRVTKLGTELKSQPATAWLEPPQRPALEAAERLAEGLVEPALAQQQASAKGLQALGEQLDKALILGRDLRSAVQRLAKRQEELVKQLEKLGEDYARLPAEQTRARLAEIAQSEKALHEALGKLEVPQAAAPARQTVQQTTGEASDLLARRDALGAFFKMEQARDSLAAWARSLPEGPPPAPVGKDSPEERAVKKQADQARQLAKEQHELREAVRKLLMDVAKSQASPAPSVAHKEGVDKLAQELMELSQRAGPEAKHAAQEAAHAAQMSQKALAKSRADKSEGRMDQAKKGEAETAMHLEMAGKKLDDAAQAMAGPAPRDPKMEQENAPLQKAFDESRAKMEQAQMQLQQQPKNAPAAMQQAAQAMKQMAKQAQSPSASAGAPTAGASPAQNSSASAAGASADVLAEHLKAHGGKTWGELPGELRTRIVQDLRGRYGDEYGPIIQRYFQQIADVPGAKKSK